MDKSLFNATSSDTKLEDDFASIKIYYDELKYTMIDQIPKMDVTSLISDIGGNLGLFLVLSICSLMEVLELIWLFSTCNQEYKIGN